jgi:Tol biopolymer transport system component
VVRLIGSLFLDGVPMVGTTVALASSGGGTLTSDGAPVDEAGGFEATLRLPLSGTGAATITASVQVEGQTVTRDVPVAWVDGVKRIAFSCPSLTSPYGTDLCTINPDGTGQARVVVDGAAPAWSHDRSRIAFSLHGALTLVNPDGSGLFTVPLPAGTTASSLSWSPDDTQLAFQELGPTVPITVCFVGTDGGGHRCLPPTLLNFNANGWVPSAWAPQPSWSPDGTRIAFVGSTFLGAGPPTSFAFTYDIYVMNVDGSGAANVTMNSGTVRGLNPAWSPDGTKLAYVRENGATFKYDIYVTTPGGGAGTPVTSSGYAGDPTWSPDGSRIAYADDSSLAVMVINADGTSVPTALAPGSTPAW